MIKYRTESARFVIFGFRVINVLKYSTLITFGPTKNWKLIPLLYLDLAIMICGNKHLMEKIPFGFIMKKLFESGFIFNLLLKRCNLRLIDYACKGNNIAAIKELTRLGTDLNANVKIVFIRQSITLWEATIMNCLSFSLKTVPKWSISLSIFVHWTWVWMKMVEFLKSWLNAATMSKRTLGRAGIY